MKKLLICGATGFIGRNMVQHFAKSNEYDVHAQYFKTLPYECEQVTWHQGDCRDPQQVDALVKGMDIIIQAAATTSGANDIVNRPHIHVTDNAVMNAYLFESAAKHKVQQVIFFSCTVMYQSSEQALKETDFDPQAPLYPKYFGVGHTKLYVEKLCEFYGNTSDTRFTAIRHSNIYGPHDKFDLERSHVCGASMTKVMTAEDRVTVWGTGEEKRDLLFVDDLVSFVECALKQQKKSFGLYNAGLGEAISVKNLVKTIISLSGRDLSIDYDVTKPTINTSLYLDCSLAKTELGWQPSINLKDGLKKTLTWYKEAKKWDSIQEEVY